VQQEPLHHQLSDSRQAWTGNPWPLWQCWNLEISPGLSIGFGGEEGTTRNDSISNE
jgi:hypothetical protein